jgi:hypothetical protein
MDFLSVVPSLSAGPAGGSTAVMVIEQLLLAKGVLDGFWTATVACVANSNGVVCGAGARGLPGMSLPDRFALGRA